MPSRIEQREDIGLFNPTMDLTLHILPAVDRDSFTILARAPSVAFDFQVDMTDQDLEQTTKNLQECMETLACTNEDRKAMKEEEWCNRLEELAKKGYLAFNKIFENDKDKEILAFLREKQQLIEKNEEHRPLSIQISQKKPSKFFSFPWALLYPDSLDREILIENFWGMRYVIENLFMGRRRKDISFEIRVETIPQVMFVLDKSLEHANKTEKISLQKLKKSGRIDLEIIRSLRKADRKSEFKYFVNCLKQKSHILHFSCHGVHDEKDQSESYIEVSDEFRISISDLSVLRHCTNSLFDGYSPVVFLNACKSGSLDALLSSSLSGEFLEQGARSVIATVCDVDDSFAADFSEAFYAELMGNKPVGECLLSARQAFVKKYKNPSGLLYSLYGRAFDRFC